MMRVVRPRTGHRDPFRQPATRTSASSRRPQGPHPEPGQRALGRGRRAGRGDRRPGLRAARRAHEGRLLGVVGRRAAGRASSSARTATTRLRDYLMKSAVRGRQEGGRAAQPQPARLPRGDREERHGVRDRPRGHRQDLPGGGAGRLAASSTSGGAHHPGAAGGGGGREARLPARRPAGQGRSLPAAALRRALRPARLREGRAAPRAQRRSRWRRSPSCAAAR